jgi:DNA modification methylase
MSVDILQGDCREVLATLPAESVQTCVTSPPYWGLRDYGVPGQLGLEKTPDEYVANLVAVFREVRRVLRDDGTLWLNLGDSYAAGKMGRDDLDDASLARRAAAYGTRRGPGAGPRGAPRQRSAPDGLKPKDLVGIPWRVAFALQADGWWLRSDIIWHKPNPMPESVTDRPTKAHEYLFLLTKAERYYYDAEAIKEPASENPGGAAFYARKGMPMPVASDGRKGFAGRKDGEGKSGFSSQVPDYSFGRNRRSVWTVATRPYKGAHFATFPPKLIEPCILAGCPVGGTVLDPFGGSGTTGEVAERHGRNAILIELNASYLPLQRERLAKVQPALGVA